MIARGIFVAAALLLPAVAAAEPFYLPPGELLPDTGIGLAEFTVFAPGMRFPLETGPAYPNSQVYMNGGYMGPGGGQCDAVNYAYPWRDNYCEKRSWDMPLCPGGIGHQGQDIRGPTCEKDKHQIVSTVAGVVTHIGSYSINVMTPSNQRFDFLHGSLDTIVVSEGQQVVMGTPLVKLSNNMGDTPTSIHLHFNIKQDVGGVGVVYVSPYMSLVRAYEELMGLGNKPPTGNFDQTSCMSLTGWAQDPDAPDAPVTVDLYFGGPKGDPNAVPVQVLADVQRDDLCMPLGSCNHGFEVEAPLSLRDGQAHAVYAYALDSEGGEQVELPLSPGVLQCDPPAIPAGVRRWVVDPESLAAWQLSPFWQSIRATQAVVEAIPQDRDLIPAPILVVSDAEPTKVWLVDEKFRRAVASPAVAAAWGFDLATVETWPAADLEGLVTGTPVRTQPVLLQGTGPAIYMLDDHQCDPGAQPPDPLCAGPGTQTSGASEGSDGGQEGGQISASGGASGESQGSSGEGSGSSGGQALPPGYGQDDDGACGCKHRGPSAPALGLLLLGLRRRRPRGM